MNNEQPIKTKKNQETSRTNIYGYFWLFLVFLVFIVFYWFLWDLGFSEDEHGVVPSSQKSSCPTTQAHPGPRPYYAAPRRVDIPGLELEPGAACNSRGSLQQTVGGGQPATAGAACSKLWEGGSLQQPGQPAANCASLESKIFEKP